MRQIDLIGKRVLVTGGSKGIGAAICRELAACGANVFINYYSHREEAEKLARDIEGEYKINAFVGGANVANVSEVKQMFELMDEKLGGIDILINNAGIESVVHALDMEVAEWERVVNINLKGPFLCSQEAGRRMEKNKSGVIINISSIHDTVPRKGLIHYCSAKAGMKMFSKCLALELAESNIRVVSVAPGAIETEMNKDEIDRFGRDKFNNWIPSGRVGNVSEVARIVAFMASDMADYINGADLYIDGAYMNHTIQYDPRPPRIASKE